MNPQRGDRPQPGRPGGAGPEAPLAVGGTPEWLAWVRELQGVAQAGLTYSRDPYDRERFEQVRGVAAAMAAAATGGDHQAIEGFFAAERGYPTPKIDVRAAVIDRSRILLVRERDDGTWSLPGGWADVGESPAAAAERETLEEAGLPVRAVKLLALYDREQRGHPPHPEYSYKAIFACTRVGPATKPSTQFETAGADWFERDALPPLSVMRVLPEQIELAFRHAAEPGLPTEFD